MKMTRWYAVIILLGVFVLGILGGCAAPGSSRDIPRMRVDELAARLKNPEIHIIDVRLPYEREKSGLIIPGAVVHDPRTFSFPVDTYPKTDTFVLYCS